MINITDKKLDRITLSYDKITNEYISEHGKESLLLLSLMSRDYNIRGELSFHFGELFEIIGVIKRSSKDKLIQCVNSMFGANYDPFINTNRTIRLPYISPKSQYLILYDEEVDYILTCDKQIDKYNLFNTYATIKRYLNHETNTAYPTIERLMFITNVMSNNTIANYIDVLEDMQLIKCYRDDRYIINSYGIRRPNNTYELIRYNKSNT